MDARALSSSRPRRRYYHSAYDIYYDMLADADEVHERDARVEGGSRRAVRKTPE